MAERVSRPLAQELVRFLRLPTVIILSPHLLSLPDLPVPRILRPLGRSAITTHNAPSPPPFSFSLPRPSPWFSETHISPSHWLVVCNPNLMSSAKNRLSGLLGHLLPGQGGVAAVAPQSQSQVNFHTLSPAYFLQRAAAIEPDVSFMFLD